jgi:hypothetical protein
VLLALPLAVAVWTFGGLAARRARNNADQALVRDLNSGVSVYVKRLGEARGTADRLAHSRRVARAFAQGDEPTLRAIEQAHPWITLRQGSAGRSRNGEIDVIAGRRTIGRIFVVPPFGPPLARDIGDEARLPRGRLGFLLAIGSFGRTASSASTPLTGKQPMFGCRRSNTEPSYPLGTDAPL